MSDENICTVAVRMEVCPSCGDKRCVRAIHPDAPCAMDDLYDHNTYVKQFLPLDHIGATRDRHVIEVQRKLARQAAVGLAKYGVTTERDDLNTLEWLRHAQMESMDHAVYLERLIQDEERKLHG